MKVLVKVPPGVELLYKTSGACAFDLPSLADVSIAPGAFALIETGIVISTPPGYMLMLAPRSSTFKNYGLMMVNSVGIIDQDYCGENDTIKLAYINMSSSVATITAGERMAQAMFVSIEKPDFEYTDTMTASDRGGFGSTGNK